RITNFDHSFSSDYVQNKNTTLTSINSYFDIHYFFQCLIWEIDEFDQLPSKCQQFIDDVLPTEFRSEDNDNFNGLDENIFDSVSPTIESPGLILRKNNFFSQFIKESMDITGSIHSKPSNSVTSLNKNNTTLDNTPTES